METTELDLSKYSKKNLEMIENFLKVTTNQIELDGFNRLNRETIIPLKHSGFGYDQTLSLIAAINRIAGQRLIEVINEEYLNCLNDIRRGYPTFDEEEMTEEKIDIDFFKSYYDLSENNYKDKLILRLNDEKSVDLLYQIEQFISVKKIERSKENQGNSHITEIKNDTATETSDEKMYWINLKKRHIIINDRYLLKKMQFYRNNEICFDYIFKRPKEDITRSAIKNDIQQEIDPNKFVNNLGFTGELRKCFFDISKNTLRFINPLTRNDLEERGINIDKLDEQIKVLENIG